MKKTFSFIIFFIFFLFSFPNPALALIIDHEDIVNFDSIPESYLSQARNNFKIAYGHTSHGSQVVAGMNLQNNNTTRDAPSCNGVSSGRYRFCDDYAYYAWGGSNPQAPSGVLSFWNSRFTGASDLGNPNRTAWENATRNMLNDSRFENRNLIIWSWCGQHNTSSNNIQTYLDLMVDLENDYPGVTFIYMTGHLNGGDGPPSGNTYLRNEQIRDHVRGTDRVLYDFADIESWDPDGGDHRDDDDVCNWCSTWCNSHSCPSSCECSHSHCFNCFQKGKAFWSMMAQLAGWNPGGPTNTPPVPTNTATPTQNPSLVTFPKIFSSWLNSDNDQNRDNKVNSLDFGYLLL